MVERPLYESLDYSDGENLRSLADVNEKHSFDFAGLVREKIEADGTCVILDAGCGNSTFGLELAVLFPDAQVYTTDIYSDDEREFYRSDDMPDNLRFIQADAESLPFKDEAFDLVVFTYSASAVTSFGDRNAKHVYVAEAGRLLKAGGDAFITPESQVPKVIDDPDSDDEHPDSDIVLRANAYRTLRQAGLDVVFSGELGRARISKPSTV